MIVIGAVVPLLATAQAPAKDLGRLVDSVFASELAAHHFTGAAIVIARDTTVVYTAGYGEADAIRHTPVDPARTVFRVASISKLFVATAVMQLAEQGRLDLTANVNKYLKDVQLDDAFAEPVSVASLLTHTSGMENLNLGSIARDSADLIPLGEYFARRPPHVDARPGSQFAYSNNGVGLAGYVVESVSGQRFDAYVEQHILLPLGMRSSSFRQPVPMDLRDRMSGGRRTQRAPLFNPYPAGALMATPADMGRFLMAHLNGGAIAGTRILGDAATRDMQQTHWSANPLAPGVAYGFFESRMNGQRVLFHTGDSGHHGLILLVPDRRFGFYVVYDTQDAGSHEMMERLTRLLLTRYGAAATESDSASPATSPSPTSLSAYRGVFEANGASPHSIEKASGLLSQALVEDNGDGRLRIVPPGAPSIFASAIAPDLFRGTDGAWIAFHRASADGPVSDLTVTGGIADPFGAHRVPWYADARLHRVALVAALLAVLSRVVVGGTLFFRRRSSRAPRAPVSRLVSAGWSTTGWLSACVVLAPMTVVAALLTSRPPYVAVPGLAKVGLVLLAVASALALVIPVAAVQAWREGAWSVSRRVFMTAFAVAVLALPLCLGYWNVLSFRF